MPRLAMTFALLLLASPALALDEIEAREAYVACFVEQSDKLMPDWCDNPDKLAEFAHQSCYSETVAMNRAVGDRAEQVRSSANLDGKLKMLGRLQKFNAAGNCER